MVERKLRPAPSTLHLLPPASRPRPAAPSATKLFVLDTNVLMHDPTSLFRFEEHDIYLPILTLEELDNNKKGMTEVARNARQVSRLLDDLVTAQGETGEGIAKGIPLDRQIQRRGDGPAVPADGEHRDGAAAVARERQGGQPDHRRRHAPRAAPSQAQRDPGVEGHQHADQGARARHGRRGLFQRQGARGHRAPLFGHARAARGLLGQARQGHGIVAARRPHLLPARPARSLPSLLSNEFLYQEKNGRGAVLRGGQGNHTARPRCCPRSRTTRTRRTTSGASRRAIASRTSRSTCS